MKITCSNLVECIFQIQNSDTVIINYRISFYSVTYFKMLKGSYLQPVFLIFMQFSCCILLKLASICLAYFHIKNTGLA